MPWRARGAEGARDKKPAAALTFRGDRIGSNLSAGVYFLKVASGDSRPVRIVKVR